MRVDDHHQVYYECVDVNTGSVLLEIPPETLREIGESINVPPEGSRKSHHLDVKS